ncbi:MAG: SprT-like domain-containing protein [Candidatus Adiutrix sp.]|jgi:uncharacterized membrane protein|nr:SprT-like domain-containing protein [Candidatus Adiutrix sp.]
MPGQGWPAAFKGAWLRQLRRAYDHLLWRHGLSVPPVSLGLMKSALIWGRWLERERRLVLSEDLLTGQPWPAVLGILAHEAVHQLVGDLTPAEVRRGQRPHGQAFQALGTRLGVDTFYLKAAVDLRGACPRPWPAGEGGDLPDRGRRVLEKVRKLLALAGSPVAAEAQAAMNAAARLLARHNLDMAEAGADQPLECLRIPLAVRRLDRRLALISHILGRHFFVKTIFVPGYDPRTDRESLDLEVLGRPENVRLSEHIVNFLLERSETLWRDYLARHPGGGLAARHSFINGLLAGFDSKLEAGAAEEAGVSGGFSALVPVKDRALEAFYCRRHPRVTRAGGRRGRRRHCPESARAGRAAGAALSFNRPLTGSGRRAPAGPAPALPAPKRP